MAWIPITTKNQKYIRVGDFVSAMYCRGVLYKVLSIEYLEDVMHLMVGICDKHGTVDEEHIYSRQHIKYFGTYSPQHRKARVV